MSRPRIRTYSTNPGGFQDDGALKQFNIDQKYSIGFNFATVSGANNFPGIKFPGTAKMLLGFKTFDTSGDASNVLTLNINNDDLVTDDSWANYSTVQSLQTVAGRVTGSSFNGEYYKYPRALSGNDGVKLSYNAATTGRFFITFYYRTSFDQNLV